MHAVRQERCGCNIIKDWVTSLPLLRPWIIDVSIFYNSSSIHNLRFMKRTTCYESRTCLITNQICEHDSSPLVMTQLWVLRAILLFYFYCTFDCWIGISFWLWVLEWCLLLLCCYDRAVAACFTMPYYFHIMQVWLNRFTHWQRLLHKINRYAMPQWYTVHLYVLYAMHFLSVFLKGSFRFLWALHMVN